MPSFSLEIPKKRNAKEYLNVGQMVEPATNLLGIILILTVEETPFYLSICNKPSI